MECYIVVCKECIVINLMPKLASKYMVFIFDEITIRPRYLNKKIKSSLTDPMRNSGVKSATSLR